MKKKVFEKKKNTNSKKNIEIKGFLFLSLSFLLFLSLISFTKYHPSLNWLGFLGYYTAYLLFYFFGLSSFLVVLYFIWMGISYLRYKKLDNFLYRSISFLILLTSSSLLLTIYSDSHSYIPSFFEKKTFVDQIYQYRPFPNIKLRHNLGGSIFYYFYKDLSFFNLKQILSIKGSVLIFSTSAIISFMFFTSFNFISTSKRLLDLYRASKKKPENKKYFKKAILAMYCKIFKSKNDEKELDVNISNEIKPKKEEVEALKEPIIKKQESQPPIKEKEVNINSISKEINYKNVEKSKKPYHLPSLDLLSDPAKIDHPTIKKELKKQAEILEETLKNFGITAQVGEINCGPTITSFEVHPSIGVKVQKIKSLENDIALNMEAKSIRIIAPIPGKAAVGVEIPSLYPQEVSLKEMLYNYQNNPKKKAIPLLLGKTVTGDYVITDLTKMPHLLIAGATGSGKSVCINTIVMSILMNMPPDEIKLLMVDPKKVELTQYSNLPHMLAPVITEAHGAYAALQWLVREMHQRYEILKQLALRNITAFNQRKIKKEEKDLQIQIPEKLPLIVAIFDEFADLMMVSSSDIETPIARIAQMARAVGIHLILATQRPSREVITGIIKANFPSRIAFKVSSRINSQIILDEVGAESLLGNGDMLFSPPGTSQFTRAQGAYIRDEDINKIIENICEKYPTNYLIPSFDAMQLPSEENKLNPDAKDELYDQALQIVLSTRNASTTYLQRKLKIGYARAASIMDELEANKVIGPQEGSKPRKILTLGE